MTLIACPLEAVSLGKSAAAAPTVVAAEDVVSLPDPMARLSRKDGGNDQDLTLRALPKCWPHACARGDDGSWFFAPTASGADAHCVEAVRRCAPLLHPSQVTGTVRFSTLRSVSAPLQVEASESGSGSDGDVPSSPTSNGAAPASISTGAAGPFLSIGGEDGAVPGEGLPSLSSQVHGTGPFQALSALSSTSNALLSLGYHSSSTSAQNVLSNSEQPVAAVFDFFKKRHEHCEEQKATH